MDISNKTDGLSSSTLIVKDIWPVAVKQTATLIHEVHMVISNKTDGISSSSLIVKDIWPVAEKQTATLGSL
jgi:hypothetical protein